jgi:hypothetical protein
VDLPSKEGVTPLMAAAGVEFGTRVTRGRNRTTRACWPRCSCCSTRAPNVNAQMVSEPSRRLFDGNAVQGTVFTYGIRERPSQMPNPNAVPHQSALHGAAERGYTSFVQFLVEHGADLQMEVDARRAGPALEIWREMRRRGLWPASVKDEGWEGYPEAVQGHSKR